MYREFWHSRWELVGSIERYLKIRLVQIWLITIIDAVIRPKSLEQDFVLEGIFYRNEGWHKYAYHSSAVIIRKCLEIFRIPRSSIHVVFNNNLNFQQFFVCEVDQLLFVHELWLLIVFLLPCWKITLYDQCYYFQVGVTCILDCSMLFFQESLILVARDGVVCVTS